MSFYDWCEGRLGTLEGWIGSTKSGRTSFLWVAPIAFYTLITLMPRGVLIWSTKRKFAANAGGKQGPDFSYLGDLLHFER